MYRWLFNRLMHQDVQIVAKVGSNVVDVYIDGQEINKLLQCDFILKSGKEKETFHAKKG